MPESAIQVVLKTLNDIMSHGVEIQLKILQTILPLLTNYNVHKESLAEALLLCFRLQDSRIVFVNNTAAATLRQLVIYIFEKVGEEDLAQLGQDASVETHQINTKPDATGLEQVNEGQLGPCALDAYLLFQDLCLLTNSEHARFLSLGSISRTFGLELIESVLTNHFHLFKQHKEFASLLRERVCPLIIKNFSDKQDFPQTMRLMRVVYILIKQFHEILSIECEIFLSMLIKLLEPEGNTLWQRVLAMEIFRGICSDNALMRRIYKAYDQQGTSTDVFSDMIIAIGRLSTEKPQLIGAGTFVQDSSEIARISNTNDRDTGDGGVGGLSIASSTMRIQCVDQLDKADPPPIPETYIYYLSLVCVNSIADGLAAHVFPIVSQLLHEQQRLAHEQKDGSEITDSALSRPTLSVFPNTNSLALSKTKEADDIALVTAMAESAWPGLLAAFSYFLGANLDEELFHNVMRAYQNFTSVCGILQLLIPRDAFLTALCKNCLPVLQALDQRSGIHVGSSTPQEITIPNITEKNMYCLRILLNVAQYLGGTLFDSWYLILETMQQAEYLLKTRLQRGTSSGQLKRTGTGNFVNNQQGGSQRPATSSTTEYNGATAGSHQDADVLALLASFKQLFDLTIHLDPSSFRSFTRALCKLGAAGSGLPYSDGKGSTTAPFLKGLRHVNKSDDKSFAIEKLRNICLLSVDRIATGENETRVWDVAMGYLIATSNHPVPSIQVRMQACDAISDIIIAAMAHAEQNSIAKQEEMQMRIMMNLRELIQGHSNSLVEIQRMGLVTLNKLLQTSGQSLSFGWALVFEMIQCSIGTSCIKSLARPRPDQSPIDEASLPGSIPAGPSKPTGLVRIAFPCLQLICTDFLSLLSAKNLQLCIDTLAAFGYQTEDLNISLTSIGLLWNVSDFVQQSLRDLGPPEQDSVDHDAGATISGSEALDDIVLLFPDPVLSHRNLGGLWMLLLYKLSTLCSDSRPEVRNGAIQTLLRTIQINAASLDTRSWRQCVWKILLPLLDEVDIASCQKVDEIPEPVQTSSFVMRNDSPSKQWDETHVLLYSGLADVFQNFLLQLVILDDYLEAWILLMEHLETASLFSSPDVAIASLKGIQTMMKIPAINDISAGSRLDAEKCKIRLEQLWDTAWLIWERIGSAIVGREPSLSKRRENYQSHGRSITRNFTQETLTEYVNIMHHLYPILSYKFDLKDLQAFLDVVHRVLVFDASPVYRPDIDYLSPLQLSIHDALTLLNLSTISGGPAAVLEQLIGQYLLAFQGEGANVSRGPSTTPANSMGSVRPTYIALCKVTVTRIVFLLDKYQREEGVYASGVYAKILKGLGVAMILRYRCPLSYKHVEDIPLWKTATTAFMECIKNGISIVESLEKDVPDTQFLEIWQELVVICHGTMAPALMGYHRVPKKLLMELVHILDNAANLYILSSPAVGVSTISLPTKQSSSASLTHVTPDHPPGPNSKAPVLANIDDAHLDIIQDLGIILHSTTNTMVPVRRERFAFACLEILFDLCSAAEDLSDSSGHNETEIRERTARTLTPVLMKRCRVLLDAYTADQALLGKCPFPRLRHQEISLVLQRLCELRLIPGVLVSDPAVNREIGINHQQLDQHQNGASTVHVRQSILAGSTAHLFYLFEPLTDAMFCHDPEVLQLLKACLKAAGRSIGLNK
ncbi:hypothetical protein BGX34_004268 [Mortierella sp. NVP85]|nr:hypothetical protein BGX34_004268 [Mortierella sp. NVP85]